MNRVGYLRELDRRAVEEAGCFKKCQARLVGLFQQLDKDKGYLELGYSSLFTYAIGRLKLSESQACDLTAVARCSQRIPELKKAVVSGQLSVSRARRLVPVLNSGNQQAWIAFASESTQKQLERKIADTKPQAVEKKSLRATTRGRSQLVCGISRELELKIDRCRDLVGGDLEATLEAVFELYLKQKDPVKKALRTVAKEKQVDRKSPQSGARRVGRAALPAAVKHQVHLRDLGRCRFPGCSSTRFIEIHHLIPLSRGGPSTVGNLITLCGAHHKHVHDAGVTGGRVVQGLMRVAQTSVSSIRC